MTKEKLSAILMPWLACPWGAMAHTSDECLQVGVASFTYLEVGLMVAMALCFVLIGMLWRYGAKMERRAKKAERDRDVCQQWYQALKHKPQEAPKAEIQKSKNTDVHDAPQAMSILQMMLHKTLNAHRPSNLTLPRPHRANFTPDKMHKMPTG